MPPFAVRKTAYCDVKHGISGCKKGTYWKNEERCLDK